jgi:hypothetical protein
MRISTPLTQTQKDFIDQSWQRLTYMQMSYKLELPSVYKVYNYCKEQGYCKKYKKQLTEHQQEFVRNNFLKLKEIEIANILGVTKFHVQNFKRMEGLAKYPWNREKKEEAVVKEVFFNVDARESWVA